MQLFKLSQADMEWLARQPETAMGVQLVQSLDRLLVVAGGQVAFEFEERDNPAASASDVPFFNRGWRQEARSGDFEEAYERWRKSLPTLDLPSNRSVATQRLVVVPYGIFTPTPLVVGTPYGHLPFRANTTGEEVFYRWEPFPISKRVNQASGAVASGTFCAPASEVPFVPSGFAAVGRYALPLLLPSNWRYELRPPAGTVFSCGACVPLFGQSGGGVEAAFPTGFTNVGPIANPVVLSSI